MKKIILFIFLISSYADACQKEIIRLQASPIYAQDKTFEIIIHAYRSSRIEGKQTIILPPFGGSTTLETRYARTFCSYGMSSFILVNWTNDNETKEYDLTVHNRGVGRALYAVEVFLNNYPKTSAILGTSLGGIYAGIAIGKFDLIKRAAIITSGTNLAGILTYGNLPQLRSQRKTRMEYFGFETFQDYYNALDELIEVRAEDYAAKLKEKKLLHFRTRHDEVINVKYQNELINLFSRDKTYIYDLIFRHRNSIIWTYIRRRKRIANFITHL